MGDKNNLLRVTSTSANAKVGHGILKALYVDTPGDIIYNIRDATTDAGDILFQIDLDSATSGHMFTAPYINHPCSVGIRAQVVSGTTGSIVLIYE
jgi:hypothetical protein